MDNSFSDFICSGVERIDGRVYGRVFPYYYYGSTQANGVIHGERSTGVGSEGMIEMVLLFLCLGLC